MFAVLGRAPPIVESYLFFPFPGLFFPLFLPPAPVNNLPSLPTLKSKLASLSPLPKAAGYGIFGGGREVEEEEASDWSRAEAAPRMPFRACRQFI